MINDKENTLDQTTFGASVVAVYFFFLVFRAYNLQFLLRFVLSFALLCLLHAWMKRAVADIHRLVLIKLRQLKSTRTSVLHQCMPFFVVAFSLRLKNEKKNAIFIRKFIQIFSIENTHIESFHHHYFIFFLILGRPSRRGCPKARQVAPYVRSH